MVNEPKSPIPDYCLSAAWGALIGCICGIIAAYTFKNCDNLPLHLFFIGATSGVIYNLPLDGLVAKLGEMLGRKMVQLGKIKND